MTGRNRDRLRQFDVISNVAELLELPDQVFEECRREKQPRLKEARLAAAALAVEILTVAPMRVGNLTALEHGRHLLPFGRGAKRQVHVVIPGEETKTGELFEAALPPRTLRLLEEFRTRYRPILCSSPSPYLFPREDGGLRVPHERGDGNQIYRSAHRAAPPEASGNKPPRRE